MTTSGSNIACVKRAMKDIDPDVLGTHMMKSAIALMNLSGMTPLMVKNVEGMLGGWLGRGMGTVMRDRLDNGAPLEVARQSRMQPAGQTALMRGMVDQLLEVRSLLEKHEADTQERIRCLAGCINEIQQFLRATSMSSSSSTATSSKRPRVIGQRSSD